MNRILFLLLVVFLTACKGNYTPKPYGYFRINLPAHQYRTLENKMPFSFAYATNATVIVRLQPHEMNWFDISYPSLNATLHVSYKPINRNFRELTEDARTFVYKHSIKADNISELAFNNVEKNVHGILYDLKGNTASNLQFTLTDSTRHFLRGALYFDNVPNKDSIAPVVAYIRNDMLQLIESFEWKK